MALVSSGPINDIDDVFLLGERPEDALQVAMDTQAASNRSGDKKQRAYGLIKAADAHAALNQLPEATGEVSEAQSLCKDLKYDEGKAALMNVGTKINLAQGEVDKAMGSANDTLRLFQKLGYRRGEAVALATRATVEIAKGESAAAVKTSKECLGIFQELGDKKGEAEAYVVLSNSFLLSGDTGKASKMVWKAVGIFRELGSKMKEGGALNVIAAIELDANDLAKAHKAATMAQDLCKDAGDKAGEATAMGVLTDVHFARDENDDGMTMAKERINILFDAGMRVEQTRALIHMSGLMCNTEDFEKAQATAEMAMSNAQDLRDRDLVEAAMEAVNNSKSARVTSEIQSNIDSNSDMLHVPQSLQIKPLWNKRIQSEFSEIAGGM